MIIPSGNRWKGMTDLKAEYVARVVPTTSRRSDVSIKWYLDENRSIIYWPVERKKKRTMSL